MRASVRWVAVSIVVGGLAFGAGCKGRPQPSPEYDEASKLWSALVQERPLDASLDPRADAVLALLEKVPENAVSIETARYLIKKIKDERAAAAARSNTPPAAPREAPPAFNDGAAGFAGGGGMGGAAPGDVDAGSPDGGAPSGVPSIGTPFAELQKQYGACLEEGPPFESKAAGGKGVAWKRRGTADCTSKFPELTGKYVLVADGKLFGFGDEGTETRVVTTVFPDGGTLVETFAPPDAGVASGTPDGGSPAR